MTKTQKMRTLEWPYISTHLRRGWFVICYVISFKTFHHLHPCEAIEMYNKALMEDNNRNTRNALREVERAKEQADKD